MSKALSKDGGDVPKQSIRPVFVIGCGICVILALSACAAGSPDSHQAASGGVISQFFLGLWHGVIAPITLLVEIFNHLLPHVLPWKTHLYESDGTGFVYDIGFYLGLAGGPPLVVTRWRTRR